MIFILETKFVSMKRLWINLFLVFSLFCSTNTGFAQNEEQDGPVYIVQAGDSLWDIAIRFGVSVDDLISANDISDPNSLDPGDQLLIPGLEGVQGVLTTREIPLGETLRSLSRLFQIPIDMLERLNHITSPAEIFVGSNLIIPEGDYTPGQRASLSSGQTLLELAIIRGTSPWELVLDNALHGTWAALPGDVLRIPGETTEGPGALPGEITSIEITPLPLVQGMTTVLRVTADDELALEGSLVDRQLNFFPAESSAYVALQGIHAMLEPGLHPLTIRGVLADGTPFNFSQMILVNEGDYLYDPPLYVDPATIDPEVTRPEDELWNALTEPVTPDKLWQGMFSIPVDSVFADCWPSRFGSRRSYNESAYAFFHTGLDFCGSAGNAIYAPAPGIVVFTGMLNVRGIATMIDHGWGVYSAYMHQSETLVQSGDRVVVGQQIGLVGNTGRVTGPHLHWEIWVGGVQVEPLEWLQRIFP